MVGDFHSFGGCGDVFGADAEGERTPAAGQLRAADEAGDEESEKRGVDGG